jgi:hypothetical protein
MTAVVGVHGIFQEQLGRNQLLSEWEPAYRDGLEVAAGITGAEVPSFDLAYYGNLFLADGAQGTPVYKGPEIADLITDSANVDKDELAFVKSAAEEAMVGRPDLGEPMGITKVSTIFQPTVRALTRHLDAGLVLPFISALRQVRLYQTNDDLAAQIRDRVTATIGDGCRVLIGHSLGSVVAYETLLLDPTLQVDTLITLGCPLPMRTVENALRRQTADGSSRVPRQIRRWVNIYDPSDPVAGAGSINSPWSSATHCHLQNEQVQNGDLPHNIRRYLSKRITGSTIAEATCASAIRRT